MGRLTFLPATRYLVVILLWGVAFGFLAIATQGMLRVPEEMLTPNNTIWFRYLLGAAAWMLGSLILIYSVPSTPTSSTAPPPKDSFFNTYFLLIITLALFFQFYNFNNTPLVAWYDELTSGIKAQDILGDSEFRPTFINGSNITALNLWIYVVLLQVFGISSIHAMRLLSVFFGLGSVVLGYMIGREWKDTRLGWLIAFFLATMRWVIHFSHLAMTGIDMVFFSLLAIYLSHRFLRQPSLRSAFWLAVSIGIGLWFYQSFRVLVGGLGIYLLVVGLYHFPLRRLLPLVAFMLATCLILTLPILIFAYKQPDDFFFRTEDTSILNEANRLSPHLHKDLWHSFQQYSLMFFVEGKGDGYILNNEPYRAALDPLTAGLFAIGLLISLLSLREMETQLIWVVLLTTMLTGLLSSPAGAPHIGRTIGFVVVVAYCAALFIWWLFNHLGKRQVWAIPILLIAMGWISYRNFQDYYNGYVRSFEHFYYFASQEKLLLSHIKSQQAQGHEVWVESLLLSSEGVYFFWPQIDEKVHRVKGNVTLPLAYPPTQHYSFFLHRDRQAVYEEAKLIYPNAEYSTISLDDPSLKNPPEPPFVAFYLIDISPEDIASVQGLKNGEGLLYISEYGEYDFKLWPGASLTINQQTFTNTEISLTLPVGMHFIQNKGPLTWQMPFEAGYQALPSWFLYHAPVTRNGLLGEYYNNLSWQGEPDYQQIIPNLYQYFHDLPVERPYSAIWRAGFTIPQTGTYRFKLRALGYVEVYLDGELWMQSVEAEWWPSFDLEKDLFARTYELEIRYADTGPLSEFYLDWQPPNGELEAVPVSAFTPR